MDDCFVIILCEFFFAKLEGQTDRNQLNNGEVLNEEMLAVFFKSDFGNKPWI